MNATREQLARASKNWIQATRFALGEHGGHPTATAYLVGVGVECAMKARILAQANSKSVKDLRHSWRKDDCDDLFRGRSGHRLGQLAVKCSLLRLAQSVDRPKLLATVAWKRMTAADRPYCLRYGAEKVSQAHASEELDIGQAIVDMVGEVS